jgi:hypothetical protein
MLDKESRFDRAKRLLHPAVHHRVIILHAIKNPLILGGGFVPEGLWPLGGIRSLTMTYFHRRSAYYHWRGSVSPSCSGWEGVVPLCYGRQTKG